jgi:hypothetical protein
MVIGDQRPGDRGAGFVVPDAGGHGQDVLSNGDGGSVECVAAVGFEVELALEGVVGRFGQLADRPEQRLAVPDGLVIAGRPQLGDVAGGHACHGFAVDEALAGDEGEARPGSGELGLGLEHGGQHFTFTNLRAGQRPQDGNADQGADQVQAQPPEPAGMRGAILIAGPPGGHLRPPDRRPGASAIHWRAVGDPDVVKPEVAFGGRGPDHLPDQRQHRALPLVKARLAGQVRKAAAQVADGVADPAKLAAQAQQRLGNGLAHQLGIGQARWAAPPPLLQQHVVHFDVQCRHDSVQISVHQSLQARRRVSNADLGLRPLRHVRKPHD